MTSSVVLYGYLRLGVSLRPGATRRDMIGFDVGLWRGVSIDSGPEGVVRREAILWPMAGFSYHWAL